VCSAARSWGVLESLAIVIDAAPESVLLACYDEGRGNSVGQRHGILSCPKEDVLNHWEALVVSNALSIAIGEGGERLLIVVLNMAKVVGNEALCERLR